MQIDRLSFLLGFLAASLFWWLLARVRPQIPNWREQMRQAASRARQKNLMAIEQFYRHDTQRRAQQMHMAAPLFALEEIIVQPWLLTPPPAEDVSISGEMPLAAQVIPYLPDWPELSSQVAVPRMTLQQALQNGRNVVVIGQPGSGKTVTLAHFALQLARNTDPLGILENGIPLFLHALDLPTAMADTADPLVPIVTVSTRTAGPFVQMRAERFLRAVLQDPSRRVVFVLDGLDEMPPGRAREISAGLAALQQKHPRLIIVTTAAPASMGSLTHCGFFPLAVCGWTRAQRDELADRWQSLWAAHITPKIEKSDARSALDPFLVRTWLSDETQYWTPLEWTAKVWSAFAGDAQGNQTGEILAQHIARYLPNVAATALEEIAREIIRRGECSLPYQIAAGQLAVNAQPALVDNPSHQQLRTEAAPTRKKTRPGMMQSWQDQVLQALIDAGVLVEHAGEMLRFSSPVFTGLLAGRSLPPEDAPALLDLLDWPLAEQTLHWHVAARSNPNWLPSWLEADPAPLYPALLQAARWLADASPTAEWRSRVLRRLAALAQRKDLPPGMLMRLAAAFFVSRDPNTQAFFRQQLGRIDPNGRRAALLGCAGSNAPEIVPMIVERLGDLESEVRATACLVLAALPFQTALDALVTVLLEGDEGMRQAAAEAMANDSKHGHAILQEAAEHDDLLTRRAAVLGLIQVHEPWAMKLLEKVSVEDGQWVVRNAAAQAVEAHQKEAAAQGWVRIQPRPAPWEAGWLLSVAARAGRGMIPGQPATDVLLSAWNSGSPDEQRSALLYLRDESSAGVIRAIYEILYGSEEDRVRDAALEALWWMSSSGVTLPEPMQFGLGG